MSEPVIVTRESVPTAVVRGSVPMAQLRDFYDRAFPAVAEALASQDIAPVQAFGLYLSPPGDTVELEVGFVVPGPVTADGDVVPGELPAGEVAYAVHAGPYDGLGEAWGRLQEWMTEHGHTPGGPVWEIYITEPSPDADPEEMRTDLFWPLAD